jgi:uncharacterized membrane protein YkoI
MKWLAMARAVAMITASATAAANDADEDARAAANAQISLTEAIHAAEKADGGKAVEAELEGSKRGQARYMVEVLSTDGKKLTEYTINASTGKVERTESEPVEKLLTRVQPNDLQTTQTTLISAIREAEQHTNGKVIDAETETDDGALHYELKVAMADGKTSKVKVDGATGKIATR